MRLKFLFLLCGYFLMNGVELYSHSLNDEFSNSQASFDTCPKRPVMTNILLDLPDDLIEEIIYDHLTLKDVAHLDVALTNHDLQKKWRNFLKNVQRVLLSGSLKINNNIDAIVNWSQKRSVTLLADQIDCLNGEISLKKINGISKHTKVLTFARGSNPDFFDMPIFSHLKKLRLHGQQIHINDLIAISHHNIEELSLEHCKECEGLLYILHNIPNLKILKINHTTINMDDANSISLLNNLEELEVQGFKEHLPSDSFSVLVNCKKLRKLQVSYIVTPST